MKTRIVLCVGCLASLCLMGSAFGVMYVVPENPGTRDGLSWETAYTSIQGGMYYSVTGDDGEVWVKEGTYNETLWMMSGAQVYGGFAGNETSREDRNVTENPTVINGGGANHVVTFHTPISNARLDGFTITGGTAQGSTADGDAGGIRCLMADETCAVANCIITGNTAIRNGGGMALEYSNIAVVNCRFDTNSADGHGGAIHCDYDSAPTITCLLYTSPSPRDRTRSRMPSSA